MVGGSGCKGLLFFCDKGVCDDRWLECTLDIQKISLIGEKNLKKKGEIQQKSITLHLPQNSQKIIFTLTRTRTHEKRDTAAFFSFFTFFKKGNKIY